MPACSVPTRFWHATRFCGGVIVIASLLALPGCRSRNTAFARKQDPPAVASPVVRGADHGLEVWSWIVTDKRQASGPDEPVEDPALVDTNAKPSAQPPRPPPVRVSLNDGRTDIEALLLPYLSRPLPMSEQAAARWRASGFRIVSVPIADLEGLQAACRVLGQVQRQWLGDAADWTDAVRGPTLGESRAITLDDGVSKLSPGKLRFLVRSWTLPAGDGPDGATPATHVEIAPRHDPLVPERDRLFAAAGVQRESQPQFIAQLATTFTVTEETALVFIPESPDADWSVSTPPPGDPDSHPFGPNPVAPASLGEVMFCSPATRNSPRSRAVIALVIHVPARFELLPR